MSGMLSVGVTGLLAYQRSLRTISHNVSNAQTEGYSRQRVELRSNAPVTMGSQFLGTGVKVGAVERVYNDFLGGQVQSYSSAAMSAEQFSRYARSLDELLADPKVGLAPAMDDYFDSVQDVANDPSAIPARQSLLTQTETLVDRYKYLNQRFDEVREQADLQIKDLVSEVNSLTEALGNVNRDIFLAPGLGDPNDLLDQRDHLLGQLAEKIGISTVEQDNGTVNVFIGNGMSLVVGFDVKELYTVPNRFDFDRNEVGMGPNGVINVSSQVSGGELGGLLDFRSSVLDEAQNRLGALAVGFAASMNDQHNLGQDLNGNLGSDLFTIGNLNVAPSRGVSNVVTSNVADASQITSSDYLLQNNGGNSFTLTRLSDNTTTAINTGGVANFTTATIDGFTLTIAGAGTAGDEYLVRPGRDGAKNLELNISDPREIAAASPIRTAATVGNAGNGVISEGRATDTANLHLPGDVTLTYVAGNQFTVGGAVPAVANIPYTSNNTIAFNGIEFDISGTPQVGDTFVISRNQNGVGDGRNALAMGAMQTQRLLGGGSASYQETYGGMVADVGIKSRQAQLREEAQSSLLSKSKNELQSLSGVNLDEEAANLMKFQQAYQAAAQVIAAAENMFQALLGAVR